MSRPLRIEYPDARYHVISGARRGQEFKLIPFSEKIGIDRSNALRLQYTVMSYSIPRLLGFGWKTLTSRAYLHNVGEVKCCHGRKCDKTIGVK